MAAAEAERSAAEQAAAASSVHGKLEAAESSSDLRVGARGAGTAGDWGRGVTRAAGWGVKTEACTESAGPELAEAWDVGAAREAAAWPSGPMHRASGEVRALRQQRLGVTAGVDRECECATDAIAAK